MKSRAHLLIVDDEANTLASLSRAFRLAGYEATVCDSAVRALELVKAQPFDMILSDVVMPEKDGLSLLEDLKNMEVPAPVVMISGQAHIEMAVRATRLGAADFLEKPLSTEKLLLTVENVLRLKRLQEENERLLLLATGDCVDLTTVFAALPPPSAAVRSGMELPASGPLAQRVEAFERETIVAELRRHQNHITQTARALGLERSHLYKKCQQLGIDLRAMRREE